MHEGGSSRSARRRRCVADLGSEIVELRVDGDAEAALGVLRAHGVAGDDAFSVGATVTVPLHDARAAERRRDRPAPACR